MKYVVKVLNYDSEWVTYCTSPSWWFANQAATDLRQHGFSDFQIKIDEQ